MNKKITLPELVDAIANHTNTSKRVSELFLKEFFGVIKEHLEQGESVKIKGLGVFKVTEIASRKSVNVNSGEEMEIAAHRRVSFTADKSLAEAINMPFEEFETITLDDNITDEELNELLTDDECDESTIDGTSSVDASDSNDLSLEDSEVVPPPFVEPESEDLKENMEEIEDIVEVDTIQEDESDDIAEDEDEVENIQDQLQENVVIESDEIDDDNTCDVYDDNSEEELHSQKRKSFVWGAISGALVSVVAIMLAWFFVFAVNENIESANEEDVVAFATDTTKVNLKTEIDSVVIPQEIKKEAEVVLDTVRTNYFLTKMSRKYFGRYEFWVYIYEENKAKIPNPNKVAPGLVVVIPPAEKYGIDKDNPESVNKAKLLAEKIL